jgi:hypothetical protein
LSAAHLDGQVAQLVEQRIENPRVAGSIPALATERCPIAARSETSGAGSTREALRHAIDVALDHGDDDVAETLFAMLRKTKPRPVTDLAVVRGRRDGVGSKGGSDGDA